MRERGDEWYRALLEATFDGILILDDAGRCVEANARFCDFLETSGEALRGSPLTDFIHGHAGDAEAHSDFASLRSAGLFEGGCFLRSTTGRLVSIDWQCRPNVVPGRHLCVARDTSSRQQAEELADFVENAAVALHRVGPDGTILWANRAELELLGFSKEEYVGRNIAEFHADAPVIDTILRRLSRGEELQSVEARLRRKDGSIRHVLISSNVLWDEARFVHTRCFTRDITERREMELQAEANRQWLRTTLEGIGDAVIATDDAGRVTFLNPVAEELTGWSQAHAASRALEEVFRIINEFTRKPVTNPVAVVLDSGKSVGLANHTILLTRDGREIPIDDRAAPIRDNDGKLVGVVLVFRDIGDRRRLELDAQRLAAIVQSSEDAIVSKDLNGIVTTWNAAAERIFGYTAEEMVGTPIARLMPPELPDEERQILEQIRNGERVEHYETSRVRKDGKRLDISVTISPVKDITGRIVGASKVARDITREKALRDEVEQRAVELAEVDRRKNEFLAMLAHELRNPLGAISNAVHLLKRARDDETRERALQVLTRQVQHQARLVGELLDVSRITRGLLELHFADVEIFGLLRDTIEDQRAEAERLGIELVIEPLDGPLWVRADRTRLAQVIDNLLNNALKFTASGGRVSVVVRRLDASKIAISVRDTGIGIEPDLVPRVFETFSHGDRSLARTRGGLGLGLAIVRGLIALHDGEVSVESEGTGRGTTARIVLPVLSAWKEPSERPGPRDPGEVLRVLIVEDNLDAAQMLEELLRLRGHEVSVAHSGVDGVRLARELPFDVVLCDLGLPEMNGYEVAAALRSDPGNHRPYLIAVTGYGQREDRRRSQAAGFDHHLVKPVDPVDLNRLLSTVATARTKSS